MDPAAAIELKILGYQKPMNDVIDRGDSPVQLFYNDVTVFLTGGSGFIGKQLIEKLFRSCAIKKMYLLMRAKKGRTIHERLEYILSDPVYDLVRKKKPNFADRIVPVEGDVADIRLGLSDDDWNMLTEEVDTVFHVAATVKFNGPLREATITNVRGTREVIAIARGCSKLKSLIHVSTAYSCATKKRINTEVFEKFYSCPVRPDVLISLVEQMEDKRLTGITERLIEDWPNTYTFTKLVAEELIRTTAKDLPVCIIRPPIVIASYYEPTPGWLDIPAAISGPSGVILAIIMGAMHVLRMKKSVKLAETPVDYVNNAIIGAGWDARERRKKGDTEIPIYAVTDKDHFISIRMLGDVMRDGVTLATDKAIYLCAVIECGGLLYWILAWLFHYIPAYLIDAVCAIIGKRPKEVKSFVGIYKKMDQLGQIYEYFTWNEWQFRNDNLVAMRNRMTEADRAIYNCDLGTVDFPEYIRMWGIGVRKYVIKDGLNNTKFGYKKQLIFRVINYIVLPSYAFLLWSVFRYGFIFVKYVLNIIK